MRLGSFPLPREEGETNEKEREVGNSKGRRGRREGHKQRRYEKGRKNKEEDKKEELQKGKSIFVILFFFTISIAKAIDY